MIKQPQTTWLYHSLQNDDTNRLEGADGPFREWSGKLSAPIFISGGENVDDGLHKGDPKTAGRNTWITKAYKGVVE